MRFSEEEISRRCKEIFGAPPGERRLADLAKTLESLDRANARTVDMLLPASEPAGHTALFRSLRDGS